MLHNIILFKILKRKLGFDSENITSNNVHTLSPLIPIILDGVFHQLTFNDAEVRKRTSDSILGMKKEQRRTVKL